MQTGRLAGDKASGRNMLEGTFPRVYRLPCVHVLLAEDVVLKFGSLVAYSR